MEKIRLIMNNDSEDIQRLFNHPKINCAFKQNKLSKKDFKKFFQKKLGEKNLYCFEVGGKVVGMTGFERNFAKAKHVAKIVSVGVLPEYRGKAISKKLYDFIEKKLLEQGVKKIELLVSEESRTAIRNYKKWGFKTEGRKKKQHYFKGKYQDIILMAKLFV